MPPSYFVDAVRLHFGFLLALGFAEEIAVPTLVRYRRQELEVSLYHGERLHELGIEIAWKGTSFALSEVIRLSNPEEARQFRNWIAVSTDDVSKGIARLRDLVERYAVPAFAGDESFFLKLHESRQQSEIDLEMRVLAETVRPRAEREFRAGCYKAVVDLYESILPILTAVERKKLEIARQRIDSPGH